MNKLEEEFFKEFRVTRWTDSPKSKAMGKGKTGSCAARWGHQAWIVNNYLYVFGGEISSNQSGIDSVISRICIEDIGNNSFINETLNSGNHTLQPQDSGSSVLYKNQLILLFGHSQGNSISQILAVDLFSFVSRPIELITKPAAREAHTSCLLFERFVLCYGGITVKNNKMTESRKSHNVIIIDLEEKTHIEVPDIKIEGAAKLKPRKDHTMNTIGNDIFVFGGLALSKEKNENQEEIFDDLFKIKVDFQSTPLKPEQINQWQPIGSKFFVRVAFEKVEYEGKKLQLNSHSACVIASSLIIFMGGESYNEIKGPSWPTCYNSGVYCYSIEHNFMFEIKSLRDVISKRISHTASVDGDALAIFGGLNEDKTAKNDVVLIRFSLSEEMQERLKTPDPFLCRLCSKKIEAPSKRGLNGVSSKPHSSFYSEASAVLAPPKQENSETVKEDPVDSHRRSLLLLIEKLTLIGLSITDVESAFVNIIKGLSFTRLDIIFEIGRLSLRAEHTGVWKIDKLLKLNPLSHEASKRMMIALASLLYLGVDVRLMLDNFELNLTSGEVKTKFCAKAEVMDIEGEVKPQRLQQLSVSKINMLLKYFYFRNKTATLITFNGKAISFVFPGDTIPSSPMNDPQIEEICFKNNPDQRLILMYYKNVLVKYYLITSDVQAVVSFKEIEGDFFEQHFSDLLQNKVLNLINQLNRA